MSEELYTHDLPPRDNVTKEKIDKHLSDEKDTISEQDMKNINTDINVSAADFKNSEEKEIEPLSKASDKDIDPEKEAPSTWDILE